MRVVCIIDTSDGGGTTGPSNGGDLKPSVLGVGNSASRRHALSEVEKACKR